MYGQEGVKGETCNQKLFLVLLLAFLLSACAAPTAIPATTATPTAEATEALLSLPTLSSSPTIPPDQIRPSAVAGSWYPSDADELAEMVGGMLAAVSPVDGEPIGLIVPHAGYAYSGPVAASGFKQLEGVEYDVAVIIAADHQLPLSAPISIWTAGGFETPLGVVPVDVELAQALVEADLRITDDPAAHEGEHPIEIELPFLQRVCPDCHIVPVLMGADDEETVQTLADALLAALPGRRAVVIASSDLSHYPTYDDAHVVDGATLAAIETFDPARVRETIDELMAVGFSNLATCACGEGPILVTMQVARGLGAETATVLRYANSGDSPQGNREQVVGYGAVMLWRYDPPDLTEAQRGELLSLARATIETHLEGGAIPDYEADDPLLTRRAGAFITLKEYGELRGCIGHTWADQPLYQVVREMAVSAATEDPRFSPLTPEELNDITVEISILSPFCRVTDVEQIEVGVHGLMIFASGGRGLLLPQVPVENGWDRETFLEELCRKAGLPAGCWQEGATLYAFTAVVFGESSLGSDSAFRD
jgi:AmmeMemoRadiSam system protein B/AmmeMemoRadiSam system protein A